MSPLLLAAGAATFALTAVGLPGLVVGLVIGAAVGLMVEKTDSSGRAF